MKNEKLFGHVTDEEAERIAAEYPTGDSRQRERIFREIERRVGSSFASGDEVREVEIYRPGIWRKIASAAAAFVIFAGAAASGGYLLYRNSSINAPGSEVSEPAASEAETEEIADEAVTEAHITKEELAAKIYSRSYDAYDQISMRYRFIMNGGSSCETGTVKRDRITGNESLIKKWSHTADYYKDLSPEVLAEYGGLDEIAKTVTGNEMFMYKDMYICVYSDSSYDGPDQYEAYDRSLSCFDDPNVFSGLYSECLITYYLNNFEMQDITENTVYLGRDCTDVRMTAQLSDMREAFEPGEGNMPETAGFMAPAAEGSDIDMSGGQELMLTVDNETGFILKAKLSYGEYSEEYFVDELLFNGDAELPEDAAYIRERIAECVPNSELTAAYDLSALYE